jgi:UDP-N-acetyl-D-mannosaminuronate dehydrogenase
MLPEEAYRKRSYVERVTRDLDRVIGDASGRPWSGSAQHVILCAHCLKNVFKKIKCRKTMEAAFAASNQLLNELSEWLPEEDRDLLSRLRAATTRPYTDIYLEDDLMRPAEA